MSTSCYMDIDLVGTTVDQTKFRGLIGSLLYLTASKPDIRFTVCLCARFQSNTKQSNFKVAKRVLKQQLEDFGLKVNKVPLLCDNTSVINLTKNQIQNSRTKHIKIRHHIIRDHVSNGDCETQFIETEKNLADIFTESLPKDKFFFLGNDRDQIREDFTNGGRGRSPKHLKFFLLVF